MAQTTMPLGGLIPFSKNPRGLVDPASVAGLAASIAARGLLQPLVVRPLPGDPDTGEVLAGCRRLAALLVLRNTGAKIMGEPVTAETQVPVNWRTVDDREALAICITENQQREAIDPIAEADAFMDLMNQGFKAKAVAAEFGVKPAYVSQRIRLACLTDEARALYAKGKVNLEAAGAIADLPAEAQTVICSMIAKGQWINSGQSLAASIRGWNVNQSFPVKNAVFDVKKSGLDVVTSLFSDTPPYFADKAKAMAAQYQALQGRKTELLAEGWKWVIACSPDAVDIYSLERSQDKSRAGVYILVRSNGAVEERPGYVLAEDTAAAKKALREAAAAASPANEIPAELMPRPLRQYIDDHKTVAFGADLARQTRPAKIAACRYLLTRPVDAAWDRMDRLVKDGDIEPPDAMRMVREGIDRLLGEDWTSYESYAALSDFQLDQLLAHAVARNIDPSFMWGLTQAVHPDVATYYRPDEYLLTRLPRPQLDAAAKEAGIHGAATMKKSVLVKSLIAHHRGTDWLPGQFAYEQLGGAGTGDDGGDAFPDSDEPWDPEASGGGGDAPDAAAMAAE